MASLSGQVNSTQPSLKLLPRAHKPSVCAWHILCPLYQLCIPLSLAPALALRSRVPSLQDLWLPGLPQSLWL